MIYLMFCIELCIYVYFDIFYIEICIYFNDCEVGGGGGG